MWAFSVCVFGLSVAIVSTQHVDQFCILRYCDKEMSGCMLDSNCKKALTCLQACSSNTSCEFTCLASYDDPIFDAFMKCTATDHACIQLAPPKPGQCHPQAALDTNFTLANLQGTWYTVKGMNPLSDCFNCQVSRYNITDQFRGHVQRLYEATAVDGTVRKMDLEQAISQPDPKNAAILNFTAIQYGLNRDEVFRILDYSAEQGFILGYYCANLAAMVFEGVFVYSRATTLTPTALKEVTSSAAAHGYNLSTFCSPQTIGC